jgi:predicted nucleic acid-binding protein
MVKEIRLCLDLNIWYSDLLNKKLLNNKGSYCERLTDIIQDGYCSIGNVQLIISWGMLNSLANALGRREDITKSTIDLYINSIKTYAELGPATQSPQLTLGGTGIIPLNDNEDAHVLDTAIAGKADVVITKNFRDFRLKNSNDNRLVIPNQHIVHLTSIHSLHIVKPEIMVKWIDDGEIPIIKSSLLSRVTSKTK